MLTIGLGIAAAICAVGSLVFWRGAIYYSTKEVQVKLLLRKWQESSEGEATDVRRGARLMCASNVQALEKYQDWRKFLHILSHVSAGMSVLCIVGMIVACFI